MSYWMNTFSKKELMKLKLIFTLVISILIFSSCSPYYYWKSVVELKPTPIQGSGPKLKNIYTSRYHHACLLSTAGNVKCWGTNNHGQLGQDNTNSVGSVSGGEVSMMMPINLGLGRTAKKVALGEGFTCAMLDNDEVKCWGYNTYGNLGKDHNVTLGDKPGDMAALTSINLGIGRTAKDISVGYNFSCAILDNDQVKCWGDGFTGATGYDSSSNIGDDAGEMAALGYVNLGPGRTAKKISTGYGSTCAILDNDQLKCWGSNNFGQLGYDDTVSRGTNPGDMAALNYVDLGVGATAKDISVGSAHACVILNNDQLKCWGLNDYGQLGYDDTINRGVNAGEMASLSYVNVGAGRTVKKVSAGKLQTCAILDNDQLKCWGSNFYGYLGYDDVGNRGHAVGSMASLGYINLGAGSLVKDVSTGEYLTCAILYNDQVKCWGLNDDGQLGYGDMLNRGGSVGDMSILGFIQHGF